jgi:hypothetical protein
MLIWTTDQHPVVGKIHDVALHGQLAQVHGHKAVVWARPTKFSGVHAWSVLIGQFQEVGADFWAA